MIKPQVRVQVAASFRIDEIYRYSLSNFGESQANKYLSGLFQSFEKIADGTVFSRPIPAEFDVQGFYYVYIEHVVYWKYLTNGDVGIATILHKRMHQIEQFKNDRLGEY